MEIFARKLKERAEQLGISNAEAARRAELDERRYAHYVSGRREPDLATLVKIARALGTSPNWLLGVGDEGQSATRQSELLDRLLEASRSLPERELLLFTVQCEALRNATQALPP